MPEYTSPLAILESCHLVFQHSLDRLASMPKAVHEYRLTTGSRKTAYATIKGFEVIRALRKGQAAIFNLTGDVRGEARIVERAFGIGHSALTEAVALLTSNLEPKAA